MYVIYMFVGMQKQKHVHMNTRAVFIPAHVTVADTMTIIHCLKT